MRKPPGWRNEPQRHSLAARGIPTVSRRLESRGIEMGDLEDLEYLRISPKRLNDIMWKVALSEDPEAIPVFVNEADDFLLIAERSGYGNHRYVKTVRKVRDRVLKSMEDASYHAKYFKLKTSLMYGTDFGPYSDARSDWGRIAADEKFRWSLDDDIRAVHRRGGI